MAYTIGLWIYLLAARKASKTNCGEQNNPVAKKSLSLHKKFAALLLLSNQIILLTTSRVLCTVYSELGFRDNERP